MNNSRSYLPGNHQARSEFGQHFLQSAQTADRIASTVAEGGSDHVLEVGAGLGLLSETVCRTGLQLTAVEIDERVEADLVQRLAPFGERARVVRGDFLELVDVVPRSREVTFASILPFQFELAQAIVRRAQSDLFLLRSMVLVGPDSILSTFGNHIPNLKRVFSVDPKDFWPFIPATIGVYEARFDDVNTSEAP